MFIHWLAQVSPKLTFLDSIINTFHDRKRLILTVNTGMILTSLNIMTMISGNQKPGISVIVLGLSCVVLFISILIGLRLLEESRTIVYPYSFVWDCVRTMYANANVLFTQLKNNKIITTNIYLVCLSAFLNICFSSSAMCSFDPSEIFPQEPDTPPVSSKPQPIGPGATASRLAKMPGNIAVGLSKPVDPIGHFETGTIKGLQDLPAQT